MPIFQLPLADLSASATTSVDPHEAPAVPTSSLQAKLQAMVGWTNTVQVAPAIQPEYPTTSAFPAVRARALALVVPVVSGQQ